MRLFASLHTDMGVILKLLFTQKSTGCQKEICLVDSANISVKGKVFL
jgi:hypothetical protein